MRQQGNIRGRANSVGMWLRRHTRKSAGRIYHDNTTRGRSRECRSREQQVAEKKRAEMARLRVGRV